MRFILFTGILVLSCVGLICCGTCFNASSVLEADAHMEHSVFRKVRSPSVYSCASECLMSSVCMSFNFETRTRTCGLNSNSSDDVAITSHPGFLFSDIRYWPKSLAGACSETPCPMSRCHVDRLSRVSCETEFQGCGAPPTVANAEMHYDGVYEGAVVVYTCRDKFVLCTTSNSIICQSTGNWNGSIGSCAQYIWDTPGIGVQLDLPCGNSRNFTVVVNVTPTAVAKVNMDIRGGGNILCHIGFRLDENRLTFNSFISGVWGTPTVLFPVPLAMGNESLVEIRLDQGMYMDVWNPHIPTRLMRLHFTGWNQPISFSPQGETLWGLTGKNTTMCPLFHLVVDGSSIHNFTDRYPDEIIEDVYISGQAIVSAAHITV